MTEGSEGHGEILFWYKMVLYHLTTEEVISVTSFSVIKFVGHYTIHVKFRAFRKATMGGLAGFWSCVTMGQKEHAFSRPSKVTDIKDQKLRESWVTVRVWSHRK